MSEPTTVLPVVAYVAGPYRDARGHWWVEQNIRRAEACALALWQGGVPCVCPHTNTRGFDGAAPDAVWLAGDLEILRRCDLIVLLPGWEQSAGARAEAEFAGAIRIPLWIWREDQAPVEEARDLAETMRVRLARIESPRPPWFGLLARRIWAQAHGEEV